MKHVFFIFILACFLVACNKTTPEKQRQKVVQKDTTEIEDVEEPASAVFNNNLITLSKSPCSGECAIFELSVTKDSILKYNGIKGVSILGEKELKLSEKQYSSIIKAIKDSDFENLKEAYDNPKASDFSNTIINYNSKDVSVRLWKDAPEKLTALYVVIEDILYDNKFLE